MSVRGVMRTQETDNSERRATGGSQRTLTLAAVPDLARPTNLAAAEPAIEVPAPRPDRGQRRNRAPISPKLLRRRQIVADAVAVVAGVAIAGALIGIPKDDFSAGQTIFLSATTVFAWMLCMGMNRLYMARAVARPSEELQRIAVAGLTATVITLLPSSLTASGVPTNWFAISFLAVAGLLVIERRFARWAFNRMRARGQLQRRVAIIGTDRSAQELFRSVVSQPELGYDVVGFIATNERRRPRDPDARIIGHVTDAEDALRALDCVGAIVSLGSVDSAHVNRLSRKLTDAGFHVALSTSLRDFDVTRLRPQAIGEQSLVYLEPTIRGGWRARAKRVFDLALATIGLVFGAPIMLLAAIAIRLDTKGPIFFRQVRVGKDGTEFKMIKLRTMVADAEQRREEVADLNESDGPLFKVADDPRITRVGRILRRTSIDELPQFWNVLRGEMSVVGPRPALPDEVAEWDDELRDRLRVLPGLTGFWQVSGRSSASFSEYKRLDLYYVDNWSLFHDVRIVLKTFVVVATQRGAT